MHIAMIPTIGATWPASNWIWGERSGRGDVIEQRSPADGALVQYAALLNGQELERLAAPQDPLPPFEPEELTLFCARLHAKLSALRSPLLDAMCRETAF